MTQYPDESTGAGDEARAAVLEALRARLLALAARVLGSRAEAEDVVQDAWFRWREADADSVRAPGAWLATVTVRLAIDRLRRLRRESEGDTHARLTQPWLDDVAPSAEEAGLLAVRLAEAWLMLLARLAPVEQAAFVLREAFECDYVEIAALVGCTPVHCRQIVHRAKARLARESAERKPLKSREEPADPAQHALVVERLREVLQAQDRVGLMELLGVSVAGAGRVDEEVEVIVAALGVSTATLPAGMLRAEPLTLDGKPGLALVAEDGELAAWLHLRVEADGRSRVDTNAASTSALQAANRAFGGAAVRQLLANVASRATPAAGGALPVSAAPAAMAVAALVG